MSLYEDATRDAGLDIRVVEGDTYNMLAVSDFAIVASGTATLESAVIGTPLVVVYKASSLTSILYKFVSTTPFLGLVNILAKKEVAPELLQSDATPEKVANKVLSILTDQNSLASIRGDLKIIKASLGDPGASGRAASAILPLLDNHH